MKMIESFFIFGIFLRFQLKMEVNNELTKKNAFYFGKFFAELVKNNSYVKIVQLRL